MTVEDDPLLTSSTSAHLRCRIPIAAVLVQIGTMAGFKSESLRVQIGPASRTLPQAQRGTDLKPG
jgi:hypothetical protein